MKTVAGSLVSFLNPALQQIQPDFEARAVPIRGTLESHDVHGSVSLMNGELTLPTAVASPAPSRLLVSRDAIVVVAVTLATFVAASHFDLQEQLTRLTWPFEHYQADELPVTLFVLALMLVWFAWRRWRQATEQLALRRVAERTMLDEIVEDHRL